MSTNKNKIEAHTKSKKDSTLKSAATDKINLDYDYNTEYGDGDVPDIDKPSGSSKNEVR